MESYKVVSARTRYERHYPGQPLCWKAAAFAHEVNELYESTSLESTDISSASEDSREIVSFGDSMEERTAVRIVSEQLSATPKSVLFVSNPTPMQILGQLHMLENHLSFVCGHEKSLDLEITKSQAQKFADKYFQSVARLL